MLLLEHAHVSSELYRVACEKVTLLAIAIGEKHLNLGAIRSNLWSFYDFETVDIALA